MPWRTRDPKLAELWREVMDRWAAPVPDPDDQVALWNYIARLAADGLWIHEALSARPLPKQMRDRITSELVKMTDNKKVG